MTLPRGLAPMLAAPGPLPPDDGWAVEVKWDGVRVLVSVEDGRATLTSRNGNDITGAYPELAGLGRAVSTPVLLDGEVVAVDAAGRPGFGLLQSRMHVRSPSPELVRATPVIFVAFDVLHVADHSLLDTSYDDRRAVLDTLALTGESWQVSPAFLSDGAAVLAATSAQGMEGVVAKRRSSRYEPGRRSEHWVKVKHVHRQSAVIGGWKGGEGGRSGLIGSLLLGVQKPGVQKPGGQGAGGQGAGAQGEPGLLFAGHVGTGFTAATLRQLGALLAPLHRAGSPFLDVPREHARTAHWVEPVLVCEVEYTGWTRDGRLRHPSYKGLRDDLAPADVTRDRA